MSTFKYKDDGLSEEHIKQICRFLDKPYVKGEYQKWHKYYQFKLWHKKERVSNKNSNIKVKSIFHNELNIELSDIY